MQLVAYGAQDIYLTGNPQITFFKVVYRRHTNFSMETIEQTINGTQQLTASTGTGTVTISRNGDLVHKVYVNVSASTTGTMTQGSDIVSEVELEIGGQRIDRHYAEWNNIWNELSTDESKAIGLKAMQCDVGTSGSTGVNLVQVPLNFWFCRNPGLALPLIALQYHEVKLKFTWGSGTGDTASTCQVMCDYIYLDTDERRRFAQVSHEYLIEQIQRDSLDGSNSAKLNFNHPVKELIWLSSATNEYNTAQLKLNGHDRFSAQEEEYFQIRQPFDFHTAVPRQNLPLSAQIGLSNNTISNLTHISTPGALVGLASGGSITTTTICVVGGTSLEIHPDHVANMSIGDTLVLVLVVANHEDSIVESPAYTEAIGDVFFSTVVASADGAIGAGSQADPVRLGSSFTRQEGANTVSSIIAGSGPSQFELYKVTNSPLSQARTSQMTDKINIYSFALKPEEHQPSGTCNFSRIDNAQLVFASDGTAPSQNIYAVNYNVLRIMSGMGGLAYSN